MALTADQSEIIKSTVSVIKQHSGTIINTFYHNLLRDVPELNNVFNQTNQITGRQAAALAGVLYAYATYITDLEALNPALEHICHKHASIHVQPAQYDVFGRYLLAAMKQVLGDALTPKILDAWQAAYKQLAVLMIGRESQLYSASKEWILYRFYLVPADGGPLPSYAPGQYVSVRTRVPGSPFSHIRQFSLSEASNRERYRITVRKEGGSDRNDPTASGYPGQVTNTLHDQTEIGDVVQLSHPRGNFFTVEEQQNPSSMSPVVLISTGVGQAPNLSILETLVREDPSRRISWVHVARSSKTHAFGPHVKDISRRHPNVQTHVFVKYPTLEDRASADFDFMERMDLGKLDPDRDLFVQDRTAAYYICGPEIFMKDMAESLMAMGVSGDRIRMENFDSNVLPIA